MSDKLEVIIKQIYKEMYENANPPRDFNQMVLLYAGTGIPFWNDLCIPIEKSEEIIERNLKGKRLTKLSKVKIRNTVMLGVSPKFCEE
jgi:hypothetical protein